SVLELRNARPVCTGSLKSQQITLHLLLLATGILSTDSVTSQVLFSPRTLSTEREQKVPSGRSRQIPVTKMGSHPVVQDGVQWHVHSSLQPPEITQVILPPQPPK
uniref:Uncharacterized protein n=1 Tax=Rhinopithecus roxellana TaxID=61622 RepID=A0A2K6RRA9_RHIRO